ncbi:hypothetical protein [Plantactinospora soyae]|uniref:Uncharacterized protein n=1 Tax=Plantactinospora soyae TaxID=1544732 RepID=A0A927MAB1_9ACTN|nr:hypothetical protein [Plantactinospora soyae]MBE1487390.1 hypothetical protein [Plantactinospora soyae]
MIPLGAGTLLEYRVTEAMWACTGVVRVAGFSFCLTDPDPPPRWHWQANDGGNGLVGATEGAVLVRTGCDGGWVNLSVELHAERPAPATVGWDEAVEISFRTAVGQSHVRSRRDGGTDFPRISFRGPGSYRIRVHARGRHHPAGGAVPDRPEDYLLQVWVAPPGHTEVLR